MLVFFLTSLVGDIYKILPMKEDEIKGADNHLSDYVKRLIVNMKGATTTYSELGCNKEYIYTINSLEYLVQGNADFSEWRQTVLNSTHSIAKLRTSFEEKNNAN